MPDGDPLPCFNFKTLGALGERASALRVGNMVPSSSSYCPVGTPLSPTDSTAQGASLSETELACFGGQDSLDKSLVGFLAHERRVPRT